MTQTISSSSQTFLDPHTRLQRNNKILQPLEKKSAEPDENPADKEVNKTMEAFDCVLSDISCNPYAVMKKFDSWAKNTVSGPAFIRLNQVIL
jgi:hypothetical protein